MYHTTRGTQRNSVGDMSLCDTRERRDSALASHTRPRSGVRPPQQRSAAPPDLAKGTRAPRELFITRSSANPRAIRARWQQPRKRLATAAAACDCELTTSRQRRCCRRARCTARLRARQLAHRVAGACGGAAASGSGFAWTMRAAYASAARRRATRQHADTPRVHSAAQAAAPCVQRCSKRCAPGASKHAATMRPACSWVKRIALAATSAATWRSVGGAAVWRRLYRQNLQTALLPAHATP